MVGTEERERGERERGGVSLRIERRRKKCFWRV